MTALFLDGFNHYGQGTDGAANMLAGAWAQVGFGVGPATPSWGARTGTYSLQGPPSFGSGIPYRYVLPATKARVFLSCGFSVDGLPSGNNANSVISFRTAANTEIATLVCQADGSLALLNSAGTSITATQGPVIVSRNWHFLEMDFNQGTGVFTLRVDDASASNAPAISATGLALGATAVGQIWVLNLLQSFGATTGWLADLFIRDVSGAVNNTWLGDRRIATLLVNADTTTAGWTPNYYKKIGAGILNVPVTANSGAWAVTGTNQNVTNGDFTVESFVRFRALPSGSTKAVIAGKYDETHNQRSYQLFLGSQALNGGSLCFQTSTDGTVSTVAQPIVYPWTPVLDQWYHIAVVRSSGSLLLFVDGQQLGLPIADSSTYFSGTAQFGLGGQAETSTILTNTSLSGWFDEFRLTVGFARYTANFTPTTVQFPRTVGGDPQWLSVALMCGFDSLIQDESSHLTAMSAANAVQQTVNDGPLIGAFSTISKLVPDDNTFISAPFLPATAILTLTANASNNNTVTVGTKDGTIAAVYTFKTVLTGAAFEVFIDTNIQNTLQNLFNAINAGAGAGTKYGTGTTSNFDVTASQLPAGQMMVTANTAGTPGNSIPSTSGGITGSWNHATLTGGTNIPGPSNFKFQRPPPRTTLISAIQIETRAFKSDAGLGSVNTALVGPLGGVTTGATHNLTVNPNYYPDVYETDPDTAGPISPTTIINGKIQINRDT